MLNVYHSLTNVLCSFYLSLPAQHELQILSQLQQCQVPLQCPLPDMVITTDATPKHCAFYFKVSGLHFFFSGMQSDSMHRTHMALQEFQEVALNLHIIAFCIFGNVVAFHLNMKMLIYVSY